MLRLSMNIKLVSKLLGMLLIILACITPVTAEVGDILINGTSKSLTIGTSWNLKEGYAITFEVIDEIAKKAFIVLTKNNNEVISDIIKEDDSFVYKKKIDGREYTIISITLNNIRSNSVWLNPVYQYSDGSNDVVSTPTSNPTSTQQRKPIVRTDSATSITSNSAILQGTVNPNGLSTQAYFAYYNPNTQSYTATPYQNVGSGTSYKSVSYRLPGLRSGTTNYYYVFATNSAGTQSGAVVTFTTPKSVTTSHSTPYNRATPVEQSSKGNSFWNFLLILVFLVGAIIIYKIDLKT